MRWYRLISQLKGCRFRSHHTQPLHYYTLDSDQSLGIVSPKYYLRLRYTICTIYDRTGPWVQRLWGIEEGQSIDPENVVEWITNVRYPPILFPCRRLVVTGNLVASDPYSIRIIQEVDTKGSRFLARYNKTQLTTQTIGTQLAWIDDRDCITED